jgi:hypothetical protein
VRLVVTAGGSVIEFVEPRGDGPYNWLTGVGSININARAGHLSGIGLGETPSAVVEIDNAGRQAAKLIGWPIRATADLYDDDGNLLLSGLIAQAVYGPTLALTIEA